jgi:hypothetical protein
MDGDLSPVHERLLNRDAWPAFDRPDLLDDLNGLADAAFSSYTVEGYLTSVLIYHQLVEELAVLLLRYSDFLLSVLVQPGEIERKRRPNRMLGQVLDDIESGLVYPETEEFVKACRRFNEIRNTLVHRLTRQTDVSAIQEVAGTVKSLFDAVYDGYETLSEMLEVTLAHMAQEVKANRDFYLTETEGHE